MPRILCFDTDRTRRTALMAAVRAGGCDPVVGSHEADGLDDIDLDSIDLAIAATEGIDETTSLIERLRTVREDLPCLLLRPAGSDPRDGNEQLAGVECLDGPVDADRLRAAVDRALEAGGLRSMSPDRLELAATRLIGRSPAIEKLLATARAVARSTSSILVEGESGTGKELVVRMLHDAGPRSHRPFVAINCAALPEGLIESTLFGHERGAFTGAAGRFIGAFERAHGGTLLLDEISELRFDLQAKLLRAIQERQFERVGGTQPIRVDVRIMATTNRNLEEEVRAGRFRADLFYRLRVVRLSLPPLRERREDIPELLKHFVTEHARRLGDPVPQIPDEALQRLVSYEWPGNVRELEHAAERAVLMARCGRVDLQDFLVDAPDTDPPAPARKIVPFPAMAAMPAAPARPAILDDDSENLDLALLEKRAILRALEVTAGHRTRAARLLGISDRTLRAKLKLWKIGVASLWREFPASADDSSGSAASAGPVRRLLGVANGVDAASIAANLLSDSVAA